MLDADLMGTAQKSTGHPGQEWALDQREKGRRDLPMDCEGKGLKATAGDRRGQGRPYMRLGSTAKKKMTERGRYIQTAWG